MEEDEAKNMEIVRNAVAPQAPKLSRDWRAIKTFGKIYTGGRIVATSNGFVGTSSRESLYHVVNLAIVVVYVCMVYI